VKVDILFFKSHTFKEYDIYYISDYMNRDRNSSTILLVWSINYI